MLLQNVPVSRKLLLLSPETAIVKGFHVPALCQGAQEEKMFEKDLAERLGYVSRTSHLFSQARP